MWNFILSLPGSTVSSKPHSYQTEEFGMVSKGLVTKICEDKFGAYRDHDGQKRYPVFDKDKVENLKDNYSPSSQIIISERIRSLNNTANTFNTFWKGIDRKYLPKVIRMNQNQRKLLDLRSK